MSQQTTTPAPVAQQQTPATPSPNPTPAPLTLTMSSGEGVPPGAYQGVFGGIEQVENDYGGGYRWKWRITQGEHKDKIASRITGLKPSPKNACGKMLIALAGRALAAGEALDLGTLIGKQYMVMVAATEQGGTRVETVAPQQ